ncbi:hypothetical protein B0H67DRAFT_641567 [Lasiosphaeris hirsuta]|uniref:Uncharacterized protein n=1 Tax=Lasiosphaeris hirsuta TaxID=260670 RepID=A0AA40B048_9PEZI|nr:hypothetical protein B0H67DRAFT_641567 [Lasiosphaeris hirsuta]
MEPSPTSNPRRTSTSPLGQRPLSLGNEPATPSSVLAEFGDEADAGVPSALELAQNVGQSYRRSRPGHSLTRATYLRKARLQSDDDRAAEKYLLYLCIALMAENDELKRELTLMQPQRFA